MNNVVFHGFSPPLEEWHPPQNIFDLETQQNEFAR
jgi:hypothetical protein